MKASALIIAATVASASAFVPATPAARSGTELNSIFSRIAGLDLFAPKSDQNDYGARGKKDLKQGKITGSSYVPAGLTAAEYQKIRDGEAKKKADNYQRNVAKAGKFLDYTDFYIKRGTDTNGAWAKSVTKGHEMAKTKYDWSGSADTPLWATKGKK